MQILTLGVVGAGQMGSGIAEVATQGGLRVMLKDIDQEYLDNAIQVIEASLEKSIQKGKYTQTEATQIRARIETTLRLEEMGKADIFVEAVVVS